MSFKKPNKQHINISDFSKHLFWDVDVKILDTEKSKRYIIHKALDYGLKNDWDLIYKCYGIKEIAKQAVTIRDLDIKSAYFVAFLAKIPIEDFLCYTTKQLNQIHWNF